VNPATTEQLPPLSSDSAVRLRIRRQDGPGKAARWEEFAVPRRPNMNVISCLQYIAAHPTTVEGKSTTPVVYDSGCLEEVCGACTMIINGRVRQSCSALVDKLATGNAITLEPIGKFPLIRDLFVDRSRLFNDLKRVRAWVPIDGTYDLGQGPPISQKLQQERYPLSRCISCGCCLEACPQYTAVNQFVGAAVISQVRLFNDHPTGAALKEDRLDTLMEEGGVADCGKAGNCVQVCPKEIPLLESIATVQRQATVYAIKQFFVG
jgi:succinate dehydrogenase / fumarate reductase, iron-sulfur subunit